MRLSVTVYSRSRPVTARTTHELIAAVQPAGRGQVQWRVANELGKGSGDAEKQSIHAFLLNAELMLLW